MKKRITALFTVFSLLFATILGRIGYVSMASTYSVSENYNSYSMIIDTNYPNLYYSNLEKINNNKIEYVAIIKPDEKNIGELSKLFTYSERQEILNELRNGYPVIKSIDLRNKNKTNHIKTVKVYTDNITNLRQLISIESNGLLSYLNSDYAVKKINYSIDAKGRLLSGDDGKVTDVNYGNRYGLKLTIDKDIQNLAYSCSEKIDNGAIIIMDVNASNILACVSKPDDVYINKCFSEYAVGSIFKLIVAATAIENNCLLTYKCDGKIKVGDTVFSCQNNHIHGEQNLKTALANSCNCYFVNLALNLGKNNILNTSKKLGFDSKINLYDDWSVSSSHLPSSTTLNSKGQLSLLGFGQGELLATPLQMCSALCTIANGGVFNTPKLISDTVTENGELKNYQYKQCTQKVLQKSTCDTLLNYMRYTVSNGTAKNADTDENQSAGKTATAQTGQYENGNEILNTWFAGVYPYNNPKYAIVILNENGSSGAEDCCPIFRSIVENLKML